MPNQSLILEWRQRWNRTLLKFLGRRVRAPADIEDLAQETYVRLLRARELNEVQNPRAYLLRVAGHVVAEWRDRRPPQEPLTLDDDTFLIPEYEAGTDLDGQATLARLDQILTAAPPVTRAVLLLRFRDDCSQKTIAAQLGMTERQAKRHLIRGYEYLRQALNGLKGVNFNE